MAVAVEQLSQVVEGQVVVTRTPAPVDPMELRLVVITEIQIMALAQALVVLILDGFKEASVAVQALEDRQAVANLPDPVGQPETLA